MQKYIHWAGWILLWGFLTTGYGQADLARVEEEIGVLQRHLASLQSGSRTLQLRSDSLAAVINTIKSAPSPGFWERRKLERLLREFQDLATARERNLREQTQSANTLNHRAQWLENRYTQVIDSLLQSSDGAAPLARAELAGRIQGLRERRSGLISGHSRSTPFLPRPEIEILAGDLPEEIEAKADFLRSRAERIQQQAGRLQQRIRDVRAETALRKKMNDLIADVRLFDQHDETIRSTATPSVTMDRVPDGFKAGTDWTEVFSSQGLTAPADDLLRVDIRSLSEQDADAYIRALESERRILSSRADSLASSARRFDLEAQELRRTLGGERE